MNPYKLSIFTLSLIIFSISLEARENPFVPTKSYMEKTAEMVDQSYKYEKVNSSKKVSTPKKITKMKNKIKHKMKKRNEDKFMVLNNGNHNILSFLNIDINDENLVLTTKKQLLKKFDLNYKKTKKIVFDFKSNKNFYTKKAILSSHNFKDIMIGAHPKRGYMRISISVSEIPSNYDVMYEGNTIRITKAQI